MDREEGMIHPMNRFVAVVATVMGLAGLAGTRPAQAQAQPAAAPAGGSAATADKRYGVAELARRPLVEQLQLSPDGKRFAAILNKGNQSILVTRAVAGGAMEQLLSTDNLESMFNWFHWANDERLVVSLRYPGDRPRGMVLGIKTWETRLVALNADGSKLVNLVRSGDGHAGSMRYANIQDDVIDWLPDGKHLLLTLPSSEFVSERSVVKVNVDSGVRTHYFDGRARVYRYVTDAAHQVRIGTEMDEDAGRMTVWVCDPDGSNWRALRRFGTLDAQSLRPLGFGKDPDLLYVLADHQGLRAVHTVNLRDPQLALKLVHAHPSLDLDGTLVRDRASGEAVGLRFSGAAGVSTEYWDPRFRTLQQGLDKALPGRVTDIVQMLGDGSTYLARSQGNGIPEQYLLGNRATGGAALLAEQYPQLDPDLLPRKQTLALKARDGLQMTGLLTLPPGQRRGAAARLPLVVVPHGGPQYADNGMFDPLVAFIAELGYAVLQVDFRGSTGNGQAFMEKGLKRWGLEMQDDLEDAVQTLVAQGTVDPQRVAIAGASYGGYAALMGAVKTPRLYRGAFAFAPVTDLVELVRESERPGFLWAGQSMKVQVGELDKDRERLVATSPRQQAHRIEVPVVLVHGTQDRQVDYEHGRWMAEALKKAGKDVTFITQDKGDHQLSHQAYRTQYFLALKDFLLKVLGPGV